MVAVAPVLRFLNVGAVVTAGVAAVQVPIPNIFQEGPRITWDITRDLTPEPDRGTISVWNLAETVAKGLREAWELADGTGLYKVSLSFGWDKVMNVWGIFDPYDIRPLVPEGPVDRVTVFNCADGGIGYRDGSVGASLAKGDFTSMVQILATSMRVVISPSSLAVFQVAAAASPIKIFDNLSLYGNARDIFNDLMDSLGLQWWILNSTIVMVPAGIPVAGPPVILTPETGLLDYDPQGDGSIMCTTLANPGITQGVALTVLDEFKLPIAEGIFRAYSVRCTGDTNTGATMKILAKKALVGT